MSKVYGIITERVMKEIQEGRVPWRKTWTTDWTAKNFVSKKAYRGVNWLALGIETQIYGCPWFATAKQIEELGGTIKEGSHYTPIYLYKPMELENEETGETRRGCCFRFYKGFNLTQTEGIDFEIPEVNNEAPDLKPCESVIKKYKTKPPIKWGSTDVAAYSPSRDEVQMPPKADFESVICRYQVLFHELAHSTGHESRLNRLIKNKFATKGYSQEELVAEITSAMLLGAAGVQTDLVIENTGAYCRGWLSYLSDHPKALAIASAQAQKAADYILGVKYEYNEA